MKRGAITGDTGEIYNIIRSELKHLHSIELEMLLEMDGLQKYHEDE